jgi:branched-chain amino acid transport system ATP-binding protein
MPEPLALAGVRAGYGDTVVLEDLDLAVPAGGALAVLGRNGVGKTTLLATVMGHTSFHQGSIHFAGREVHRLPVYERSRLGIGYVP